MSNPDLELRRRHSASHIMTAAVKMLFPEIKLGVGPWTDTGFYQDFDLGEQKISDADFKEIEKKMRWITNKDFPITKKMVSAAHAKTLFAHDPYKTELIEEIEKRGEEVSLYLFGDLEKPFYTDLCAGPHLESTGQLGAFQLVKTAGAYWRGDEKNAMLTRIYGVAFESPEALDHYKKMMEEAEKRDHRKLGKELNLFTFSDLVGPGLPLFTPKGTVIREELSALLWKLNKKYGYQKVDIPHLAKPDLYKVSGHWDKYKDDGFLVTGREKQYMLKPMNCPHHTQIYASEARSYRDLPQRYFEVTKVYRDEQSGEILGLSRVISITQDDGHVFCRADQIEEEIANIVGIIKDFYREMGMLEEGKYHARLSVRDPKTPEKYLGDHKIWDTAEATLEEMGKKHGLHLERGEGEAAFYGPKLDFMFQDAIGRTWQLATIQLDFVQPERFQLEFTNKDGQKERPVMIHRAISGSLERFIGILIEHYAGAFPAWLAPVQAHILPVNEIHEPIAKAFLEYLQEKDARVELYDSSDSLGKRIRNCQKAKVPYAVILGDNEVGAYNNTPDAPIDFSKMTITVRKYGEEKDEKMGVEEFLKGLGR
ncbi:MAG: threonine--tRNA ligase [Candidatus Peregrinibacteria bacterium]